MKAILSVFFLKLPVWALVIGVLTLTGCSSRSAKQVDINALLTSPAQYEMKEMTVSGILAWRLELHALFQSGDALASGRGDMSIWLHVNSEVIGDISALQGKLVAVTGVFRYSEQPAFGHLGGWRYELTDVKSISLVQK